MLAGWIFFYIITIINNCNYGCFLLDVNHLIVYLKWYFQEDEKFLPDLLGQLQDENTPDPRKLELVQFLKEFCNFSQNLQPPQKENFFKVFLL